MVVLEHALFWFWYLTLILQVLLVWHCYYIFVELNKLQTNYWPLWVQILFLLLTPPIILPLTIIMPIIRVLKGPLPTSGSITMLRSARVVHHLTRMTCMPTKWTWRTNSSTMTKFPLPTSAVIDPMTTVRNRINIKSTIDLRSPFLSCPMELIQLNRLVTCIPTVRNKSIMTAGCTKIHALVHPNSRLKEWMSSSTYSNWIPKLKGRRRAKKLSQSHSRSQRLRLPK